MFQEAAALAGRSFDEQTGYMPRVVALIKPPAFGHKRTPEQWETLFCTLRIERVSRAHVELEGMDRRPHRA